MSIIIHFLNSKVDIHRIIEAGSNNEAIEGINVFFSKQIDERLYVGDNAAIYNEKTNDFTYGEVYKTCYNDFAGSWQIYAVRYKTLTCK